MAQGTEGANLSGMARRTHSRVKSAGFPTTNPQSLTCLSNAKQSLGRVMRPGASSEDAAIGTAHRAGQKKYRFGVTCTLFGQAGTAAPGVSMAQRPPPLQRPHPSGIDGCSCPHPLPKRPCPCDREGATALVAEGILSARDGEHEVVRWAIRVHPGMARPFILDCHTVPGGCWAHNGGGHMLVRGALKQDSTFRLQQLRIHWRVSCSDEGRQHIAMPLQSALPIHTVATPNYCVRCPLPTLKQCLGCVPPTHSTALKWVPSFPLVAVQGPCFYPIMCHRQSTEKHSQVPKL